tara:strand:+ start:524 stop:2047 length:1524 start_codon:yes stop_codon:yes gene_type:complete
MQTYLFRILCACFLSLSLILTSCSNLLDDTSSSDSDTSRGALSITNITMDSYPVSFMAELIHGDDKLAANVLAATGLSFDDYIDFNSIGTLGFAASVNQYNLVYHTIDAKGNATLASAKLLIPDANTDLDLVVYLHGTTSLDSDAPTNAYADFSAYDGVEPDTIIHNIDTMAETAALMGMVASTNTAVLMPDYLGFGASEGLHPYMHGASLASSTIDAIRAALNFANLSSNPFSLTGDFTLTGYSEGGYAVMATHKELLADDGTVESAYLDIMGDSKGSKLKAVIPGAPPCNISQRMAAVMLADGYLAPGFAPYVVLAYNEIYDIEANISSIFNPTYNFVIDDFDGTKSITDISTSLVLAGYDIDITDGSANAPIDLFTDTFKTDIMTDYTAIAGNYGATLTDEFYQKFKENDVFDYHVGEDVYYEIIYHAADLIVPATNSTDAGDALVAQSSRPLNEFTALGSANPDGINLHQDITPYPIGTTHTSGGSYYLLRSFTVSKTLLNAE